MPTQREMWDRLGDTVELLVIGGGITGAGIARDAARRGLTTAVVEMSDLASGTSSRSSKLIHGGLRYLELYEFGLVFEAVSERRILMDLAPHLVRPQGFLFPVYEHSPHKLWFINVGMWLYDTLSLFRSPRIHKKLSPKELLQREPVLGQHELKGAPLYYDCATDDARLTLETALDAAQHGAVVVPRCKVERLLRDDSGRLRGAVVRNTLTGEQKEVAAHAVVNATGPWTDRTRAMGQPGPELLRPTKGVHVVVPHHKLPLTYAIVCRHPTDARVLFAIPWGDRSYLGTTDTDFDGDPADVAADLADVDYLIDASNAYFPAHPLTRDDIIATWAGLRPLIAPGPAGAEVSESTVSREHQILVGQDGMITIAGGKLTTYRRMAAEVVDTTVRLLQLSTGPARLDRKLHDARTASEPLPGAVGWPGDDNLDTVAARVERAGAPHLSHRCARHLAQTYGMLGVRVAALCSEDAALAAPLVADQPDILAQVRWAADEELAATVGDVLIRRTQVYYRDREQGLGCCVQVARLLAERLGWSDAERERQVVEYRDEVARSRRWRSEATQTRL